MWCSYNPEGPSHWAKRMVVDRSNEFGAKVLKFQMRDNPVLSEDVIERYDASFTGHFHKRLVEGEWAPAQGAIFPVFHRTNDDVFRGGKWHIALDWAVSGTLAALAISSKGEESRVLHELYHRGNEEGVLTELQVCERVTQWWREVTGHEPRGHFIWLDPSTPASFKNLLRRKGFNVRSGDNDVIPGIVSTANKLERGQCTLHNRLVELPSELAGYTWDAAAADKGEDKPTKFQDHGCDALRYFVHSTSKVFRSFMPTSVRGALYATG